MLEARTSSYWFLILLSFNTFLFSLFHFLFQFTFCFFIFISNVNPFLFSYKLTHVMGMPTAYKASYLIRKYNLNIQSLWDRPYTLYYYLHTVKFIFGGFNTHQILASFVGTSKNLIFFSL